jgi:adenosine deaminase
MTSARRRSPMGEMEGDASDPLTAWLRAMPKAELHLHLDGSLRPTTALELALERRPHGLPLPQDVASMKARLVAPPRCRDQAELLRAFDLPVALLQDAEALERCALELVEDVAAEGTRYAEIRWAPSLHLERGLSLADGIAAVARGAARGAIAAAVEVRLIVVALRTHGPTAAQQVVAAALAFRSDGVVGFDLAGVEQAAPDPRIFQAAFDLAREGGLGITCHAGEWGGAAQVRAALSIAPWRIAHGAPAADDPQLMAELRDRGVTLDLCPSSNLQAGIGSEDTSAPLPRLLRAGVQVTVSTDDRTVSDLTLVRELERCVRRLGLTPAELSTCMRRAYQVAFLHHDEDVRVGLVDAFESWAASHPVPA